LSDLQVRLARLHGRPLHVAPGNAGALGATLAERIARLRVRAAQIDAAVATDGDVARLVDGHVAAPMLIAVTRRHPFPLLHGRISIADVTALAEGVRVSAGLPQRPDPESLLFLDTETTGLAGGTGTLAFLVGTARVRGGSLEILQLLLTGFGGERDLLDRVRPLLERAGHLVTFNGKSFDLPLLRTRARLADRDLVAAEPAHLDLLHVTRRRLREDWPDCRLRTAETEALGFSRVDDLPGAEVPAAWQRWLQRRDPALLPRILDHNREDLVSLAALLAVLAGPTGREAPLLKRAGALTTAA
jgi:uncharacterized protein YprB with RNaseH-like and TPR domain